MNLPNKNTHDTVHHKPRRQVWVVALSISAIVISLLGTGFSAFVYFNTPTQIHNYVQSHKNELKGEDGRDGIDGMDGRNGSNSYSPTRCSSYQYSFGYSTTNCY